MLAVFGAASLLAAQGRPPTLDPTYTTSEPPGLTGSTSSELPLAEKWIWAAETRDRQVVYLQRQVTITTRPGKAVFYITADNYFQASVDGNALGGTTAGKDSEDNGWRTIHSYDVTPFLRSGTHVIRVTATNAGGPAGVLARLDINGKRETWTDKSWKVSGDPAGPWVPATEEAQVGGGPWGDNLSGWPEDLSAPPAYLLRKRIEPVAVAQYASDPDSLAWVHIISGNLKWMFPRSGDGTTADVVLDFGKELTGRVSVTVGQACDLTIAPGESAGEAVEKPYVTGTGSLKSGQSLVSPWSAERYACLHFKNLAPHGDLFFKVFLDHLYYPVAYRGSFDCSDPLLTKLWYTGAYTAHLCMQQDIWDAPKRDRARWMGDLHVSGETIDNAFLDRFLMEHTMSLLRSDAQGKNGPNEPPNQHVNGIPGYSCAWIAGLADFYRHTGDLDYLRSQHAAIIGMLAYLKSDLGNDGIFANVHAQWPFVDWSPDFDKDTPQARAATHLFFAYAAREASFLLHELGDAVGSQSSSQFADDLARAAQEHLLTDGTFGDRRQENAMAVYSGVATKEQWEPIYKRVFDPAAPDWKIMATPYYNNYVIFAMSEIGHTQEAMNFVRGYWGEMVKEGATSFWESYDPSWDKHDFHKHLNADDGTGFFVSLCHGWSSGVTSWLTERVLGVRPTGGGFSTCEIAPDLADLSWASGDVPTPHGKIHLRVDGNHLALELPAGVLAHVVFKGQERTVGTRSGRLKITL